MIIYKKANLFDAPKGSILVHACNAQGVWGKGIAAEFKKRFPNSYEMYRLGCMDQDATGIGVILSEEKDYRVGCLITSKNYDKQKDSVSTILKNTKLALTRLLLFVDSNDKIYSNKFNSGLFGVPWEETEKVLNSVLGDRTWTVMDPNLEEPK